MDLDLGRHKPPIEVFAHPTRYEQLINTHGSFARIMRSRKCPCSGKNGTPRIHCNICKGDGFIYDFQRRLIQIDEKCIGLKKRSNVVHTFYTPIMEVMKLQRLSHESQRGIEDLTILSHNKNQIIVKEDIYDYDFMRISYYFDRFVFKGGDKLEILPDGKTLIAHGTIYDDKELSMNAFKCAGDITIIEKIYDETGKEYKFREFRKTHIILDSNEPEPQGSIYADYWFAPVARVGTTELDSNLEFEKFSHNFQSANIRFSIHAYFEVGEGDLITLLMPEFYREQIISHNAQTGIDKLMEFDISRIVSEVITENGIIYEMNKDFILQGFRDIKWIGKKEPKQGELYSIKYAFHPTYQILQDVPVPHTAQNKWFPKIFHGRIYNRSMQKDYEQTPTFKNSQILDSENKSKSEFVLNQTLKDYVM